MGGELVFLLPAPIDSLKSFQETHEKAIRGVNFLDNLEKQAGELDVQKGALIQSILPFGTETSAADQSDIQNKDVTGPAAELPDEIRQTLVDDAVSLRKLIRVKIADNNDLEQAKDAVTSLKVFCDGVVRYSSDGCQDPYKVLTEISPRDSA